MMTGTEYLQALVRLLGEEAAIRALYYGGDPADRIDLYLVAPSDYAESLAELLALVGEHAFTGEVDGVRRVLTHDGLELRLHLVDALPAAGLTRIFDRAGGVPVRPAPAVELGQMSGHFWSDLHRAAGALGRGRPLAAHAELERCRRGLLELYRLAGVAEPHLPWLVAPLEVEQQWRCAHRLATTYESLMLPLCQRLGVEYPMAVRNLAFRRLEEAKPDRGPEAVAVPKEAEPERPQEGERRAGLRVARGRIRR